MGSTFSTTDPSSEGLPWRFHTSGTATFKEATLRLSQWVHQSVNVQQILRHPSPRWTRHLSYDIASSSTFEPTEITSHGLRHFFTTLQDTTSSSSALLQETSVPLPLSVRASLLRQPFTRTPSTATFLLLPRVPHFPRSGVPLRPPTNSSVATSVFRLSFVCILHKV